MVKPTQTWESALHPEWYPTQEDADAVNRHREIRNAKLKADKLRRKRKRIANCTTLLSIIATALGGGLVIAAAMTGIACWIGIL